MAATQPARFGEDWSDERIKGFLNRIPPEGESADFHALYNAYKHMRAFDFERFLKVFVEAGRNVDATNPEGKTLLDLVREHPAAAEFIPLLEAARG